MQTKSWRNSALVVLAVGLCVVIHALADPDGILANVTYLAVLVGASVGACLGAMRAAPGQRLVPRLIAGGITLGALGDVLWSVLDMTGASTDVSVADPPWFLSYVLLCAALWVVLGERWGGRAGRVDLDSVIDAATIVVVSILVFWNFSISSIVTDHTVSPYVRTVWAAYPVADAVLLALVLRVLMSRRARAAIDVWFALGVGLWLAADVAYLHTPESGAALILMDAAWMIAPVLMARAAWRAREPRKDTPQASAAGGWAVQLAIAIGPLLVPPGLELVDDLRGVTDQPLRLLVSFAPLIALAFARTARLIRSEARVRHELEEARDAALEASRAKSMFLANMSHEIRTPLTTVLATAEILEDTPLDEMQIMLLKKMHRSGDLLKTLVEGVLDFSRIEAGELVLASKTFDLHDMVSDVADVYSPRAIEAGIHFEWRLDPCVPRMVVGDPGRLFQVLTNLLDNAMKFTHQGTVTLEVRPARNADPRGRLNEGVEFAVDDTGIGISAEDQSSVFESFSQVDGSTTRRYGGSGLGLAICKQLTQLMGGSITLRSHPGIGSTFTFRIPLTQSPQSGGRATALTSRLPTRSEAALVAVAPQQAGSRARWG